MPETYTHKGYLERVLNPKKSAAAPYFRGAAVLRLTTARPTFKCDAWDLVDPYLHMTITSKPVDKHNPHGLHDVISASYEAKRLPMDLALRLLSFSHVRDTKVNRERLRALCMNSATTLDSQCHFFTEMQMMPVVNRRTTLFFFDVLQRVARLYGSPSILGKLTHVDVEVINDIVQRQGMADMLLFPEEKNFMHGYHFPRLSWASLERTPATQRRKVDLDSLKRGHDFYYGMLQQYVADTSSSVIWLDKLKRMLSVQGMACPSKRRRYNDGGWTRATSLAFPDEEELLIDLLGAPPYNTLHSYTSPARGRCLVLAKDWLTAAASADHIKAVASRGALEYGNATEEGFLQHMRAVTGFNLHPRQEESIRSLLRHRVIAVCGPPGCGKTSVFIKAAFQLNAYAREVRKGGGTCPAVNVVAVAPTGMAAYNVSQTAGPCTTIDLLYKTSMGGTRQHADVLVIEEASACDEKRLYRAFKALAGVEQLVLVFDNNQIPPVGKGFPSRDILRHLQLTVPDAVHTYSQNFRFSDGAAAAMESNCKRVLARDHEGLQFSTDPASSHPLVIVDSEGDAPACACELWMAMMRHSPQKQAQILAFQNVTVTRINNTVYEQYYAPLSRSAHNVGLRQMRPVLEDGHNMRYYRRVRHYMVGMRIVFTKNYYGEKDEEEATREILKEENHKRALRKQGPLTQLTADEFASAVSCPVMNGESWDVCRIDLVERQGLRVAVKEGVAETEERCDTRYDYKLYGLGGSKWVYLEDLLQEHIRYGMCITGNKSQGSQYPHVIICLEDALSPNLSLNLLYTEMSRAQNQVFVVTNRAKYGGLCHGALSHVIKNHPENTREGALGVLLGIHDHPSPGSSP